MNYVAHGFDVPNDLVLVQILTALGLRGRDVCHRILLLENARGGAMNQRKRFIRKIVYACDHRGAADCRSPGSASPRRPNPRAASWPRCATDYRLSQAQLGEIDPASETIKLATLGMRGVAANLLWSKANEYHKNEDWVNLAATLEQLRQLQPNFVSVWIFQGWNLSYNISVQFDDYHDRYYWVIRGIDFLQGRHPVQRQRSAAAHRRSAIRSRNKIGRADEKLHFRQLFRDDDDFHGDRPKAQRDNWLVGREWMLKAEDAVAGGVPLRGETPLLFYSHPVMCLINYAEAIEEEGVFGEVAKEAWGKAAASWNEFSNRDLPTQMNIFARLSEMEAYHERSRKAQETLARFAPEGVRQQIMQEKIAGLPEDQRALFEADPASLSEEKQQQRSYLEFAMAVQHHEVADRVKDENRAAALKAAEEATIADEMARNIEVDRGIVNYNYWKLRCEIEPTEELLTARKQLYDANAALRRAEIVKALELYESGMQSWRKVLDAHPQLIEQVDTVDELAMAVNVYKRVLDQNDKPLPKPFVLQDVLDKLAINRGEMSPEEVQAAKAAAEAAASDPTQQ